MKRRFFSLIELMVSFSIIAMIGLTVGIWVVKKIEKERFYSDVMRFEGAISLCQKIAKTRQADVFCTIKEVSGSLKYEIDDLTLAKGKNLISHSSMQVDGAIQKSIQIEFSSNGNIYPSFEISFYSKDDKYVKKIRLEPFSKVI